MRQTFLTIVIALMAFAAGCVECPAQLRYGFNIGGSLANTKLSDAAFSADNKRGFRGGLTLEYQLPTSGLAFDGSVLYHRYNTKLKVNDERSDFGRNFIEVPLNVKYKFWMCSIRNLAAPFIYTGPSFMFHVDPKHSEMASLNRFQPGWNVGVGFDIINFLQIQGGYRFGIGNAIHRSQLSPEASMHLSGWNISATLLFDF